MTDEHKWHISQGAVKAWHRRRLEEGKKWAVNASDKSLRRALRNVNENIEDGYESAIGSELTTTEWKDILEAEIARRQA